ncbi:MAG: YceI family protein [Acidobacteriota bacterium]
MRHLTIVTQHFLAVLMFAACLQAETFEIRPIENSRFALTVEKTGLMRGRKHLFLFERYRGTLEFNAAQPEQSRIQLSIEASSVVCKDEWVSISDLQKIQKEALEEMLAAKRYPTIAFTSSSVKPLGGTRYEAQGTLTIRDVPKPVTVLVELDAKSSATLRLAGSAKIRLTDYKLKPPLAILGAIGTKDEMTLDFQISGTRQ